MSAVADQLREARALIAKGWTQDQFARNAYGYPVSVSDPAAVCWCAMGAMGLTETGPDSLYSLLSTAIGNQMVGEWNDAPERTQAEVLAAFDKAIELAEQSL